MRFLSRMRRNARPMSAAGVTDVGVARSSNEDSFTVLLGKDAPTGQALLAVADGMGGHSAGEVASRMALDLLKYELSNASSATDQSLRRAALLANEGVYSESTVKSDLRGMGTTLVAGLLTGNDLLICNIGDSRAYLLRGNALRRLTKDHSWVAEMVDQGLLTPEQASVHPRRNVLTRALGVDKSVQADITRITLRRGDRVLLCSDGLHALVSDSEIASMLRAKSLKNAASDLVEAAKSAGGDDNITVIVAQMDSEVPSAQSEDTLDSAGATLPPRSPRELADPMAATSDLSAPWTVSPPPARAESPPVQPPPAQISDIPQPPRRNRLPLFIAGGFGAIIVIALIAIAALRPGENDSPPARPIAAIPVSTSTPTATPAPTAVLTATATITPTFAPTATATPTPTPSRLDIATESPTLSAGYHHTCGLRANGEAVCWR